MFFWLLLRRVRVVKKNCMSFDIDFGIFVFVLGQYFFLLYLVCNCDTMTTVRQFVSECLYVPLGGSRYDCII